MDKRCIAFKELQGVVSLSRAHVNRLETDAQYAHLGFPKRVQLTQCRVCWWMHEIQDWLMRRPRAETR